MTLQLKNPINVIQDLAINYQKCLVENDDEYIKEKLTYNESIKFLEKIDLSMLSELSQDIFFVWIGTLDISKFEYLKVWRHCTNNITIWFDSRAKLFGVYKEIIKGISEQEGLDLLEVQNRFYLDYKNYSYSSFDSALEQFTLKCCPSLKYIIKEAKELFHGSYNELSKHYNLEDISDLYKINSKDCSENYEMELILRGNLCAASDIARLSILYELGGIYVDLDTLPYLSQNDSDEILRLKKIVNGNLIDILISTLVVEKYFHIKTKDENLKLKLLMIKRYFHSVNENINHDIELFVNTWDMTLLRFPSILCHKNGIKISSNENNNFEFNNNIMASMQNSKLVNIIIKEMNRRYTYIIKHGYTGVHDPQESTKQEYYERLRNYRLDGMGNGSNVTLMLSGPTLILETILGCAYKVFDVDVNSYSLSLAIRNTVFGVGISKQTMFTIEHTDSNWMLDTFI